jgi:polyferredoxin
MEPGKKKGSVQKRRTVIQIIIFALIFCITTAKGMAEKNMAVPFLPEASLHAICPFGGVETIYRFLTEGLFIQKVHSASLILMVLSLITAVLFGTIFCGYLCPFGSFQEWAGKLGRKLFGRKYNHVIPEKADRVLKYLRYPVLILVLYHTAVSAKLVFQSVDPYYALFNFFTDEVAVSAYIVLGVITLMSLVIERPWCRYFCPYGALLGLFNPIRIFKLRRNRKTCTGCRQCDRVCPMNIRVSEKEVIGAMSCITCHRCLSEEACPSADTVIIAAGKGGDRNED